MEPKIIKVTPYTGINKEEAAAKGKKTKITLYSNKMVYEVSYEHRVEITMQNQLGEELTKDSMRYVEEKGTKEKSSITDIIKYIKTDYDEEGLAFKIHIVDVVNPALLTTFEVDSEEEQAKLYNDLYEWKFGKDE